MGKTCNCCKIDKNFEDFNISKNFKDGYRQRCRACEQDRRGDPLRKLAKKKRRIIRGPILKKRWRAKMMKEPSFRINRSMSAQISHALKGMKNGRHWESLVTFTLQELMIHLERLFLPGMTWGNRGIGEGKWHIDHIIPRSFFKFTSPEDVEFKICWSLSNLQPLWAKDNLRKGAKILEIGGK